MHLFTEQNIFHIHMKRSYLLLNWKDESIFYVERNKDLKSKKYTNADWSHCPKRISFGYEHCYCRGKKVQHLIHFIRNILK